MLKPYFHSDYTCELEIKPIKGKNYKMDLGKPVLFIDGLYRWQSLVVTQECTLIASRIKNLKGRTIKLDKNKMALWCTDILNLTWDGK